MKAIIVTIDEASGSRVRLLGTGETEVEARRAAYCLVNGGYNEFDSEYSHGDVVDVSPTLAAIINNADDSHRTYDGSGNLVGLEASDNALLYQWATGTLYVSQGVLHSRYKLGDKPWA